MLAGLRALDGRQQVLAEAEATGTLTPQEGSHSPASTVGEPPSPGQTCFPLGGGSRFLSLAGWGNTVSPRERNVKLGSHFLDPLSFALNCGCE